jgi:hypothetical protein
MELMPLSPEVQCLGAGLQARLVLHRAGDVVLGIGELHYLAHAWNVDDRRTQLAAGCLNRRDRLLDRADADGAAKGVDGTLGGGPLALGDQAAGDAVLDLGAGEEGVEIRGPPGSKRQPNTRS